MTLPFDIHRCAGTESPTCAVCRRREPGDSERQTFIAPEIDADGECGSFIEPAPEIGELDE